MPWQTRSEMSLKLEFAKLADQEDANMSALCRRFNISRPSGRPFPSELPTISYPAAKHVRTVSAGGQIWFAGNKFYIGEAFDGDPVAVCPQKPQQNDAGETVCRGEASKQKWAVYYCHELLAATRRFT